MNTALKKAIFQYSFIENENFHGESILSEVISSKGYDGLLKFPNYYFFFLNSTSIQKSFDLKNICPFQLSSNHLPRIQSKIKNTKFNIIFTKIKTK